MIKINIDANEVLKILEKHFENKYGIGHIRFDYISDCTWTLNNNCGKNE